MSRRLALPQVVSESMIHIIEPVATQSVKYIINRLGLSEMMKDEIYIVSDFKESSKSIDKNGNPKLITYRTTAKLTPNVNPNNNKWEGMKTGIDLGNGNTLVRSQDAKSVKRPWSGRDITDSNHSLFHDDDLFVDMSEWNVGSTMTLEVRMDFRDLTPAQETLSKIFATFTNGDMIGYAPIQYDYPIPKNIQHLLKYFFKISGKQQDNQTFANWLTAKSKGSVSVNVNRNNVNVKEIVGLHNGVQALYLIECSQDAPEVRGTVYSITFNLTVQYARTNRVVIDYPIIVNNTPIESAYVPMAPAVRAEDKGPFQWQNKAVNDYWTMNYMKGKHQPIKYPWWDRWEVPFNSRISHAGFRPLMTVALTLDDIDNPNGVTEVDITKDLPGYTLDANLLSLFKTAGSKALDTFGVYVNVTVFSSDVQVDNTLLEFDGEKLTLKSRRKLPIYRLVLSINDIPKHMPKLAEVMELEPVRLERDTSTLVGMEYKTSETSVEEPKTPDDIKNPTPTRFLGYAGSYNLVWINAIRPKKM